MQTTRRALALITSAALLASLAATTVAAPASAAKPKCFGKPATIVGTNKGERIVGTNKRDVIVAKGGNDRIFGRGGNDLICGGSGADRIVGGPGIDKLLGNDGSDRLFGGPGPDRLFAGVGNDLLGGGPGRDVLDGGLGTDRCYQNAGVGPIVRCELPAALLGPAPPASPAPPKLIPLSENGILAVAYSDIDGLDGYSTGDIMISRIIDTHKTGTVTVGDTVEMGRYPLVFDPKSSSDFGDWSVKSHMVKSDIFVFDNTLSFLTDDPLHDTGAGHTWYRPSSDNNLHQYFQSRGGSVANFQDRIGGGDDILAVRVGAPSQPETAVPVSVRDGDGDDTFVDVEFVWEPFE